MSKRLTLAQVCFVIAVTVAVILLLASMPVRGRVQPPSASQVCRYHLHDIGLANALWLNDRDQQWVTFTNVKPFDSNWYTRSQNIFGKLYPTYTDSLTVFDCPAADRGLITEDTNNTPGSDADDRILNADFVQDEVVAGGSPKAIVADMVHNDPQNSPAATSHDRPNHDRGSNVLFKDHHVRIMWSDATLDAGGRITAIPNPHLRDEDADIYYGTSAGANDAALQE